MSSANDAQPIAPVASKRSILIGRGGTARIVFWATVAAAIPLSQLLDMGTNTLSELLISLLLGGVVMIGTLVDFTRDSNDHSYHRVDIDEAAPRVDTGREVEGAASSAGKEPVSSVAKEPASGITEEPASSTGKGAAPNAGKKPAPNTGKGAAPSADG
ncbi:MAG: hypothetical protein L0H73_09610 [Nitrococcus sp.]|nr:hypothetical protein [Nitrococcus sp.]